MPQHGQVGCLVLRIGYLSRTPLEMLSNDLPFRITVAEGDLGTALSWRCSPSKCKEEGDCPELSTVMSNPVVLSDRPPVPKEARDNQIAVLSFRLGRLAKNSCQGPIWSTTHLDLGIIQGTEYTRMSIDNPRGNGGKREYVICDELCALSLVHSSYSPLAFIFWHMTCKIQIYRKRGVNLLPSTF